MEQIVARIHRTMYTMFVYLSEKYGIVQITPNMDPDTFRTFICGAFLEKGFPDNVSVMTTRKSILTKHSDLMLFTTRDVDSGLFENCSQWLIFVCLYPTLNKYFMPIVLSSDLDPIFMTNTTSDVSEQRREMVRSMFLTDENSKCEYVVCLGCSADIDASKIHTLWTVGCGRSSARSEFDMFFRIASHLGMISFSLDNDADIDDDASDDFTIA